MALIFGKQLTAEQRLEKATIKILGHKGKYEALTGILLYGDITVDDTTPTACTDGKNEKYGRAFVGTLTDAELRFVRLHEVYHKMYRHLLIWRQTLDRNHLKVECHHRQMTRHHRQVMLFQNQLI